MLGVRVCTVTGWETGREDPKVSYLPRIIAFIGYDPFSGEMTFGERLRVKRWKRGLTQHKLARQLGIATCTLQRLEAGTRETKDQRVLKAVQKFLEGEGQE